MVGVMTRWTVTNVTNNPAQTGKEGCDKHEFRWEMPPHQKLARSK